MAAHVRSALTAVRIVADRPDPTLPMSVGELSRRLARGVSATSRLCAELERLGLLERADAYGAYRLGTGAIALSGRAAAPLARTMRYALTLAAQQTGETALLATPSSTGIVVTAAVESLWTLHSPADVGERILDPSSAIARAADPTHDADEGEGLLESTSGMSVEIASPVIAPTGDCIAVLAVRLPANRREQNGMRARRAVVAARRTLEAAFEQWLTAPRAATVAQPGAERPTALEAVVQLLDHLATRPDTVAGAAAATGLRIDRAQRLLDACRETGLVVAGDVGGLLQVGWAVHGWYRAAALPTMVSRGKPHVAVTAHRTRTCGFITVLKGMRSFTVVEELEMAGEGLRMAPWLGRAHPIVGSDGGPALVMDFTPAELTVLFPARNTAQELKVFLERVRRTVRDDVLSMEAFEDAGIVSISAPIRDASGTVAGAACLVGTTAYMYSRLAEFESEARALAARVSRELVP
jgi:DNA-binding IclR family transcriptional regulator